MTTANRLQTRSSSVATAVGKEATSSQASRCNPGCTGKAVSGDKPSDDELIDFVASLTPEQWQRLVDLFTGAERRATDACNESGSRII